MSTRTSSWRLTLPKLAGLAVVGALALTGCAGTASAENPAHSDAPREARAGGELTMLMHVPTRSFDPADDNTMASTGDATRMSAIYDLLLVLDPVTGEVRPQLAESMTPNDDGSVWTLRLRDGVTFSDGTPLDAAAVQFTYQHIAEKGISSQTRAIQSWSMTVVDPLTLEIAIPTPNMHLDRTIADSLPFIVSPTAVQADPEGFASAPVGAGPFVLDEYEPDNYEVYSANPEYWQEGLPKLDGLRLELVPDAAQRINTIASGAANAQAPSSDADAALLANAESQGLVTSSVAQNGGGWIYLNNERPPFDDERARRAMYLALDRAELAQVALGSAEATAIDTMFVADSPYHEADITFPEPDTEEAQALFDELADEGAPVEITYVNIAGEVNSRTAQFIQAKLSEFENVTVDIETLDVTAAREQVFVNRDYDMSPYPGAYKFPDPEPGLYNLLASGGLWNTTGYANADVDAALDAARATADPEERRAEYRFVQEQFMSDLPGLFTFTPTITVVADPSVAGMSYNARGVVSWPEVGFAAE
ncbi:ABC transporter substrate-binding protein [Leucobacter allii]|uniref:ABC transporter substrate-binding protein n=1 Tax=Leucobacter allii TaxID=2932247 RepID=UPI001FD07F53|nr:ABC transporter substrate-binding protein [Leucobacter allii]UOR01896.1 ABC transporter substrate-binding protein [Leucobacter allii]